MKYVRTKDGRIVEESKLEPGLKQNLITMTRKNDNKEITQLNVDYASDYINWVAICEYCRCHKINPKDIKYEITTLFKFNDVLKQADTIEELCDEFVDTSELKTTNTGGWLYDEFDSDNKCLVYYAEDERRTIPLNEFDDLSKIYGAIWTGKGLIYVAKMNKKGELELL